MDKREKVLKGLEICKEESKLCFGESECGYQSYFPRCWITLAADALELLKEQESITGETSDGYHTFNELYHHRAVLFSVIVANYKDRAWKSVRHHDGTMYDGMFIVGIDTPEGQATYHYDIDPYWDMFDCKVREFAPEWDGHTPAQAIERIGKLKAHGPRVMTLKEVNALDWDYCYLEEERLPGKEYRLVCGEHILTCVTWPSITAAKISYGSDGYGKRWRCWTSRPTDEQREATPWTNEEEANT